MLFIYVESPAIFLKHNQSLQAVNTSLGGEMRKLVPHHTALMQNWTFKVLCCINPTSAFGVVMIFDT